MKMFSVIRSALKPLISRLSGKPDQPVALQMADYWRKKGVQIGENTRFYGNVVLGRDGQDPIVIGSNCVLTGCTILGHDASTNDALGIKRSMVQPVFIEDNCFIGHGSIVLMGVRIGKGSIVGAGAVVTADVPPNVVVVGNPARTVCTVDDLANRRYQLAVEHPEYFPETPARRSSQAS
jgi:maltose O-acetyltransferase